MPLSTTTFDLIPCRTEITYNLEIYPGKQPEGPFQISNTPVDVVKRLAEPIYTSYRIDNITADNCFTDIDLVKFLQTKQLSYFGTIRKNKRQLPSDFVTNEQRRVKASLFGFQKDVTVVSYVPKKEENVILVSSMHFDNSIDERTGDDEKPDIITFYNQTKSGVDLVDKICATFNVQRNTRRWPLVVFFAMLNFSGINSQVIYIQNGNEVKKRSLFLKKLSREFVAEHMDRRTAQNRGIPLLLRQRLNKLIPDVSVQSEEPEPSTLSNKRKRCVPCTENKRKRYTKYFCELCKQFLCLEHITAICENCFKSRLNCNESNEDISG